MKAVIYMRTSTDTNADGDSSERQRAACLKYAKAKGITIVAEYYDVISGATPVTERESFMAMVNRLLSNGVRTVLIESPDRFARDLTVQLVGHDWLKAKGIELVPVNVPDYFSDETPTAVLIRQVLGAIAQFEKAQLVGKLKAARDRKSKQLGYRIESHALTHPEEHVLRARALVEAGSNYAQTSRLMAEAGMLNKNGKPYHHQAIKRMISGTLASERE